MAILSSIKESLSYLFNWKKNPKSVFFFALPLAGIGVSCLALRAILEYIYHDDPWFMVIFLGGCFLGYLALRPAYVILRDMERKHEN